MWLKKIKKKGRQFALIAVIMMLSAAIFCGCIGFVLSVYSYVYAYYSSDDFSGIFVTTTSDEVVAEMKKWKGDNQDIKEVNTLDGYYISSTFKANGAKYDPTYLYVLPVEDYSQLTWDMSIREGGTERVPEAGTVWVSGVFADNYGVHVGDDISFSGGHGLDFTVGAIVNNALVPSAMLGFDYIFISPRDEGKFSAANYYDTHLISVQKNDGAEYDLIYDDLVDLIGDHIGGIIMTNGLMIGVTTMVPNILGGISAFSAFLIFIGAIMVIRFILNNDLQKEYQAIGCYKAVGFRSGQIRGIYIKGYGLVIAIAILLGIAISIPAFLGISKGVLINLGEFVPDTGIIAAVSGVTLVLLTMIVLLSLLSATRKVKKLSPMEAINASSAGAASKTGKPVVRFASTAFETALNSIFKHKKINLITLIVLILSMYLLTLFVNINYSIGRIRENANIWFGTPRCSAAISCDFTSIKDDIESYLYETEGVVSYVEGDMILPSGVTLDTLKYSLNNTNIGVAAFNAFSDEADFPVVSGRNPQRDFEVSVNRKILEESGLELGDQLELKVNGKLEEYTIVGSYASLLNLGYNIRILTSNIERGWSGYVFGNIFVRLKDSSAFDEIKATLEDRYDDLTVEEIPADIKDTLTTVEAIVDPVIKILVVVFIAFALINIINIIALNNINNRREYGIMKAFGFTTAYIIKRCTVIIMALSLCGAILALGIHFSVSAEAFNLVLGGIDGMVFDMYGTVRIVTVTFVLIVLATVGVSIGIRQISPKELIEE